VTRTAPVESQLIMHRAGISPASLVLSSSSAPALLDVSAMPRPFEALRCGPHGQPVWSADGRAPPRMPPLLALPVRAALVRRSAARNLGLGIGGACCISESPAPDRSCRSIELALSSPCCGNSAAAVAPDRRRTLCHHRTCRAPGTARGPVEFLYRKIYEIAVARTVCISATLCLAYQGPMDAQK
jgi:hypothetical protein